MRSSMIDQQSLIDLNILPGPESRGCLQTKLDYCQTKGGKAHLQSLLKLENLDYIVIRERQACIQHITTHFPTWRLPIQKTMFFTCSITWALLIRACAQRACSG